MFLKGVQRFSELTHGIGNFKITKSSIHLFIIYVIRYFSQGIPTILFTSMPFVIHGVWLARKDGNHIHMVPVYMSLWLVLSHSLLKHKEFRFIQPIIPLTSVYIGMYTYAVYCICITYIPL